LMRARSSGHTAVIRNPESTRPWQHVLEPLAGYLLLARGLLARRSDLAESWNFGPAEEDTLRVRDVVELLCAEWPRVQAEFRPEPNAPHEAKRLKLDCAKARARLGWKPIWSARTTLELTANWYRAYYDEGRIISEEQLDRYVLDARRAGMRGV
jgi:CDP-glucose 4,6-dehydratase